MTFSIALVIRDEIFLEKELILHVIFWISVHILFEFRFKYEEHARNEHGPTTLVCIRRIKISSMIQITLCGQSELRNRITCQQPDYSQVMDGETGTLWTVPRMWFIYNTTHILNLDVQM